MDFFSYTCTFSFMTILYTKSSFILLSYLRGPFPRHYQIALQMGRLVDRELESSYISYMHQFLAQTPVVIITT